MSEIPWEKQKMLVTSIFFFSHDISKSFTGASHYLPANRLNLDMSIILLFGKVMGEEYKRTTMVLYRSPE